MTRVNIDSGSIENTSVDVSSSTLTTSAAQKLAILEGAESDVNFGDHKISATMGEFTSISGFTAMGAIDFSNQAMTRVNIDSGSIDNTNVNVSGSTFTTSATQKHAILEGAGSDVNFGDHKISAATGEFTSISGFTAIGAIDFSNQAMTNVNVTSGSVAGSTVQLASTTGLENEGGLKLKQSIAGSGLVWNTESASDQILDLSSGAITSVGTLSGLEVSGNAVFTSIAEKLNTVGSESSNTIDYNDGGVVYLTLSGASPYTYDIINVPDLNAQTHVITVITKSSGINTDDYATSVKINGSSYDLIWNAGSLPELDTVANDIITQQFSILPLDLVSSPGKVLTNVSYYKSASAT